MSKTLKKGLRNALNLPDSPSEPLRSRDVLKSIQKSVWEETGKLKILDREFKEKLKAYYSQNDAEKLVDVALKQLVRQYEIATAATHHNTILEKENMSLASHLQWEPETRQRYEQRRSGMRKEGTDLLDQVANLRAELEEQRNKERAFSDSQQRLLHDHESAMTVVQKDLAHVRDANTILSNENREMGSKHALETQNLITRNAEDNRISKRRFDGEMNRLEDHIKQLKGKLDNEDRVRQKALLAVRRECDEEKTALSQVHKQAIDDKELKHARERWDWSQKEINLKSENEYERLQWDEKVSNARGTHEREIDDLRFQHEDILSGLKNAHETNIEEIQGNHEDVCRELNASIGDLQERLATQAMEIEAAHSAKMKTLRGNHSAELEQMKSSHGDKIERMNMKISELQGNSVAQATHFRTTHAQELSRVQSKFDADIANMKKAHEEEVDRWSAKVEDLKDRSAKKVSELKKGHEAELEALKLSSEKEVSKLKQQLTDTITSQEQNFKEKTANLERRHAAEKEQLRKDRDSFSAALRAREKFEGMKDVDIKSKFQVLMLDVEKIARLDWNSSQAKSIGRPPVQQMRQILQDTIWVLLHDGIFCSPFRIFGEAGKTLEQQWNNAYGKDPEFDNGSYVWPKPGVETERWRYMSIQECHAALEGAPSELDPRAKYKVGYITAMEELNKKLRTALGDVIEIDKANNKSIERMTRKAAMLWIEMGMQRFRIVVFVQQPKARSVKDRVVKLRERNLELVVNPELKTHGNSKGSDLQVEKEIFESDISVWPSDE